MRNIAELRQAMASSAADQVFMKLYGETKTSKERYLKLIDQFAVDFPDKTEVSVYSTPGRTEVGGNHTDHNAGRVLAGAVDLDVISFAAKQEGAITIHSEGYDPFTVALDDLQMRPEEI